MSDDFASDVFTNTYFNKFVFSFNNSNSRLIWSHLTSFSIKSVSYSSCLLTNFTFFKDFAVAFWFRRIFYNNFFVWNFFLGNFWFRTNLNHFWFTWVFFLTSHIVFRFLTLVYDSLSSFWRFWVWNVSDFKVSIFILTFTNFSDFIYWRNSFYCWSVWSHFTSFRVNCVSSSCFLLTVLTYLDNLRFTFWKVRVFLSSLVEWDFFFYYFWFVTNFDNLRFTWVNNFVPLSFLRFTLFINLLNSWVKIWIWLIKLSQFFFDRNIFVWSRRFIHQ